MSISPVKISSFPLNEGSAMILHVEYNKRYDLCSSFFRISEYYESSIEELRGKYFSLEKAMDLYAQSYKNFSYSMDWSGFNIPGAVLESWFLLFSDKEGGFTLEKERNLCLSVFEELSKFPKMETSSSYYVIGTYLDCPRLESVILHEIAHAFFSLVPEYRKKATSLVSNSKAREYLEPVLKSWGYSDRVIVDELHAYLTTSSESELKRNFDLDSFEERESLVDLFRTTTTNRGVAVPKIPEDSIIDGRILSYRKEYGYNAGEIV